MKRKPTEKEINGEIATLEELKGRLKLKRSAFGDDHGQALDAQIEVLRDRATVQEAYNRHPAEENEDIAMDAGTAAEWLEDVNRTAPSAGWIESPHLFHPKR